MESAKVLWKMRSQVSIVRHKDPHKGDMQNKQQDFNFQELQLIALSDNDFVQACLKSQKVQKEIKTWDKKRVCVERPSIFGKKKSFQK